MFGRRAPRAGRDRPRGGPRASVPTGCPTSPSQAGQLLHQARGLANNARDELRNELGPEYSDLELRDLDPRTIVRKHITEAMAEDDREQAESAKQVRPPRRRGPAVRRRGHLTLAVAASVVAALHGDERGVRHQDRPARRPVARPSTKSAPTRSTYASWRVPSARWSRQRAPASARRRRAAPRPSRSTGDHATSGTERSLAPRTPATAAQRDDPVLPGRAEQAPALPDPVQPSLEPPDVREVERHVAAARGHQPAGERDGAVLGPRPVGELGLAVGLPQRRRLPLEVVEQREQLVLPGHGREPSHAAGADGLWRNR